MPADSPPGLERLAAPVTSTVSTDRPLRSRGGITSLRTFDSLGDRNFRWLFASLLGNFMSMHMQMFMRGWLAFELTGSFTALGIVSLAMGVPGLGLALAGGVLADRVRQKKHVLQVGQTVNALATLSIGLLIASDLLRFEHLVVATVIQGAVQSTVMPSQKALTPDVVGVSRLTNAVALHISGLNGTRLLAPGLAGWMVGALSEGGGGSGAEYVYFSMAALALWSVVGLLPVRAKDRIPPERGESTALRELFNGLRYIAQEPAIRMLLLANFFMVLFSWTYIMLLPGFAKDVLHTGPAGLGLLTSLAGVGSLTGSLFIASLPNRHRGTLFLLSALALGVALAAFSASAAYWVSAGIIVLVGFAQASRMALTNILLQSYADAKYRGRVMSVHTMATSLMNVTIFFIALLANSLGSEIAIGGSAVALIVLSLTMLAFSSTCRKLD